MAKAAQEKSRSAAAIVDEVLMCSLNNKQPIRANNDIEGWHNALNRCAGGQSGLPLYLLIELLEREARLTSITIRLVSNEKLSRIQRKCYRNVQRKLLGFWEQYENRKITAVYFT